MHEWSRGLIGCISFIRIPTSFFIAAVVFFPLAFSGWPIVLAVTKAIPFFFTAMFAFAFNDLSDVEKDRISKPYRALPSGMLSLRVARVITAGVFCLSCISSFVFASSVKEFVIYAVTILSVALYNVVVQRAAEAKAFVTALISIMPFAFVTLLLGDSRGTCATSVILYLYISSRELKMDIRDVEGDRSAGISTIAIRFGKNACLRLSYCLLIASVICYLFSINFNDPIAVGIFFLTLFIQLLLELSWILGKANLKRYSILAQWVPMAIIFFSLV